LPETAVSRYYVKIRQRTQNTIRFVLDQREWDAAQAEYEEEDT